MRHIDTLENLLEAFVKSLLNILVAISFGVLTSEILASTDQVSGRASLSGSSKKTFAALYTNPLTAGFSGINLGVDLKVAETISVGPYASWSSSKQDDGTVLRTTGVGGRMDFWLTGEALRSGWYASPFASRYTAAHEIKSAAAAVSHSSDAVIQATNVGGTFGYAIASEEDSAVNFLVRVGLGLMHSSVRGDKGAEIFEALGEATGSFWPTADVHVGLVF